VTRKFVGAMAAGVPSPRTANSQAAKRKSIADPSIVRTPCHVCGLLAGLGKPSSIQHGSRTSTDPGARIVDRIVFRMGPRARHPRRAKKSVCKTGGTHYCKIRSDGRVLRRCIETLLPSLPAWIPAVPGQVFGDISSTGRESSGLGCANLLNRSGDINHGSRR
jgi:hypothetical protein